MQAAFPANCKVLSLKPTALSPKSDCICMCCPCSSSHMLYACSYMSAVHAFMLSCSCAVCMCMYLSYYMCVCVCVPIMSVVGAHAQAFSALAKDSWASSPHNNTIQEQQKQSQSRLPPAIPAPQETAIDLQFLKKQLQYKEPWFKEPWSTAAWTLGVE